MLLRLHWINKYGSAHHSKQFPFLPEGVRVVSAGEGDAKVTKELEGKDVGIVSMDEEVTNVTRDETETGGKNSESSTGEESMVIGPLLVEGSTDLVSSLSMFANTLAPIASVVSSRGSLGSGEAAGEGVEMFDICFLSKQNLVSLLS